MFGAGAVDYVELQGSPPAKTSRRGCFSFLSTFVDRTKVAAGAALAALGATLALPWSGWSLRNQTAVALVSGASSALLNEVLLSPELLGALLLFHNNWFFPEFEIESQVTLNAQHIDNTPPFTRMCLIVSIQRVGYFLASRILGIASGRADMRNPKEEFYPPGTDRSLTVWLSPKTRKGKIASAVFWAGGGAVMGVSPYYFSGISQTAATLLRDAGCFTVGTVVGEGMQAGFAAAVEHFEKRHQDQEGTHPSLCLSTARKTQSLLFGLAPLLPAALMFAKIPPYALWGLVGATQGAVRSSYLEPFQRLKKVEGEKDPWKRIQKVFQEIQKHPYQWGLKLTLLGAALPSYLLWNYVEGDAPQQKAIIAFVGGGLLGWVLTAAVNATFEPMKNHAFHNTLKFYLSEYKEGVSRFYLYPLYYVELGANELGEGPEMEQLLKMALYFIFGFSIANGTVEFQKRPPPVLDAEIAKTLLALFKVS